MKILVTGGGGFLGSTICHQLLARNEKVIAFQRSDSEKLRDLGADIFRGCITDKRLLETALQGVDAVIHTAARAGPWGSYAEYYQPNVLGTENVIAACRSNGIHKLVFTSSPSVVHSDNDIEGGDESLPYPEHFSSHYPATKALAEQRVMAAHDSELQTISLRPHLIWGPGDQHLLPRLVKRARSGKIKLPAPEKLIDAVYIDNAAGAHLLALDCLQSRPEVVGGKTYFISNDEPISHRRIIGGLLEAAGLEVEIPAISPRLVIAAGTVVETIWRWLRLRSEPPITRFMAEHLATAHWFDISAAKRDLSYEAEVSIAEGLERLRLSLRIIPASTIGIHHP